MPGSIRFVFARGDRVVEEGRFTGDEHRGAYVPVGRVSADRNIGGQARNVRA